MLEIDVIAPRLQKFCTLWLVLAGTVVVLRSPYPRRVSSKQELTAWPLRRGRSFVHPSPADSL